MSGFGNAAKGKLSGRALQERDMKVRTYDGSPTASTQRASIGNAKEVSTTQATRKGFY